MDVLLDILRDKEENRFVQETAERELGEVRNPQALGRLLAVAMDDAEQKVRDVAGRVAMKTDFPAARDRFLAMLRDPGAERRRRAARALGGASDPSAHEPLLKALQNTDLVIISGAYRFFIGRGVASTTPALISALEHFGDKEMAEDYVNCGQDDLKRAAEKWADDHGYKIVPRSLLHPFESSAGQLRWGGGTRRW